MFTVVLIIWAVLWGFSTSGLAGGDVTNPAAPGAAVGPRVLADYGGSASCQQCHVAEFQSWQGSHHALAERPVQLGRDRAAFDPAKSFQHGSQSTATHWTNDTAVVTARGLSHHPEAHAVDRVIGENPLRQFLVPFPGGRWQTLEASYDPIKNEWFDSFGEEDRQPGEWGHWSGRGMNWNTMCASCHNTRLRKNYDPASDTYHTTMAEPAVGCEACHGPLAAHNTWQKQFGNSGRVDPTLPHLTHDQVVDTCGACHALRGDLTGDFQPGEKFADHYELLMVDASERYYADGQIRGEDYEYGSFLSSRMHQHGVYCLDCHDPHSARTRLPGNALCLRCHATGIAGAPVINPADHSHHQVHGFVTNGQPAKVALSGYNAKTVPESGGECVNCHMPQTRYMQRHWRHDHGFTSPDALLTQQFGIPNACNRCHQDQTADWALKYCNDWYGSKMDRPARQRAQLVVQAQRGELTNPEGLLAWWQREEIPYWRAVGLDLLSPWASQSNVLAALQQGLADTNALVRAAAARALEPALAAGGLGVAEALTNSLADPSRNVRVAAAWTLRGSVDEASRAGRDLKFYLDFNADEPIGQMNEGNYAYARGDLATAANYFKTSVAWDPYSPALHENLAVVLSQLNQPQAAVATLEEAVKLAPQDAEAHYQLALADNEVGAISNTVVQLTETVRLNPRHAAAWYNLGLAQNTAGKTAAALDALAHAERADPADPRIPYVTATILARLGKQTEAVAAVKRALAIDPGNAAGRGLLRQLQP